MKPTTKNRWLKLIAWLMVLVIIVMLLIPKELTDEQFVQIKPGMTMVEVHRRIGNSNVREGWTLVTIGDPGEEGTVAVWLQAERWLQPKVDAVIPAKYSIKLNSIHRSTCWLGKSSLLWIEHENDKVLNVWLIPVTKQGGGLQGCINSLREHWNNWRK